MKWMFSDEFTCLLLYLSWNVLICNLHLKNMIHPKDSSPMMRFSNSHFCVQMVTVIKNEHFLKKRASSLLLVVQPWNHWEYLGWLWKNKIILLSSLLHFPHFFSWCSKIQGLLHGLASKKIFPWKLKKKSCRLFDPENLTILYGNKTLQNFSQFDTVVDTLEELFCAYQVAMIEQKRNAHFFFFSFGKPQLTGENGGKLNFSRWMQLDYRFACWFDQ